MTSTTPSFDTSSQDWYHILDTIFHVKMKLQFSHFINCWKKSFDFKGRSTRSEYWSFFIINWIFLGVLIVANTYYYQITYISILFLGATLFPYASSIVRRVRDTGSNLWILALCLIPYAGQFILFFLLLKPSKKQNSDHWTDKTTFDFFCHSFYSLIFYQSHLHTLVI